jgi:hypothetical protein
MPVLRLIAAFRAAFQRPCRGKLTDSHGGQWDSVDFRAEIAVTIS